jgi:ATP-dependent Clp protease ATP-binding subunit ClpA
MQRMLHTATREAALWGDVSVGIEHLLLAIVAERKGVAARVLQNVGVTQERLVGITRAGSNE